MTHVKSCTESSILSYPLGFSLRRVPAASYPTLVGSTDGSLLYSRNLHP